MPPRTRHARVPRRGDYACLLHRFSRRLAAVCTAAAIIRRELINPPLLTVEFLIEVSLYQIRILSRVRASVGVGVTRNVDLLEGV